MSKMFQGCCCDEGGYIKGLRGISAEFHTKLDISSFDTSACLNMSHMFEGSGFSDVVFAEFDTSSCTDMSSMFCSCHGNWIFQPQASEGTEEGGASSFVFVDDVSCIPSLPLDTSSCQNMSLMFSDTDMYGNMSFPTFNTSSCEDMSGMFSLCSTVKSLDLSFFNTSSCKSMAEMFSMEELIIRTDSDLPKLEKIESEFDTSSCMDMNKMFAGCQNLSSLNTSSFTTSASTDLHQMFYDCSSLRELDLSGFDKQALITYFDTMFIGTNDRLDITWPSDWQQVKEEVGF